MTVCQLPTCIEGVFYLDTEQIVPPLCEMTSEVAGGLSNHLQPDVVPGHPGNSTPVIHVLFWFVQGVEVRDSGVAVILACNAQR